MVEKPLTIEWSFAALADLDRFAAFLHQHDPRLASSVARSLVEKVTLLAENPDLGRTIILVCIVVLRVFQPRVALVPTDYPLRVIRSVVNAALERLSAEFSQLYSPHGRASIAPEKLLHCRHII